MKYRLTFLEKGHSQNVTFQTLSFKDECELYRVFFVADRSIQVNSSMTFKKETFAVIGLTV